MTLLKTALVALAAASACAPALAEVQSNKGQVAVSTADLDLNNPRDAQILLQRIKQAAAKTCKDWESVIPRKEQDCRKQVVSDNVARLNINALGVAYVDAFGKEPALASRD